MRVAFIGYSASSSISWILSGRNFSLRLWTRNGPGRSLPALNYRYIQVVRLAYRSKHCTSVWYTRWALQSEWIQYIEEHQCEASSGLNLAEIEADWTYPTSVSAMRPCGPDKTALPGANHGKKKEMDRLKVWEVVLPGRSSLLLSRGQCVVFSVPPTLPSWMFPSALPLKLSCHFDIE